ncbi:MAG: peptide transporter [Planctomycetaceae bacterium]|nr:peptide transporter [Planctomycetaceae bacterium]
MSQEQYRELTVAAVVLGIIQGIILNVAFVYAALKLGFSIGGSTVAAIMGYAILRGVMRKGTMVENNINQTIASGMNTAGTGIVFTVPALFLLQASQAAQGNDSLQFSFLPLAIAGIAGAILGVVVIIPLRKQMIELDRLRFPSGVATATIIRAGSTGLDKAILLGAGVLISVIWKLLLESGWLNSPTMVANWGFGIQSEELHFGFGIIPDYCAPVVYLSLMNMAAGMLAGRGGIPFFLGGAIAWWVISPATVGLGWAPATEQGITLIGGQMLRPIGIGVIIGGALMGVVMSIPAIRAAFATLASATKTAGVGGRRSDEMSMWTIAWGTGAAILLFFLASRMTEGVTTGQAIISAIVGTLWLGLAALIVAQATGLTDISPMSGMALISVTLMMFLLNKNVAAAMVVGVAVCVAIGQGADMMQDLKTGFMIGARPIKQQIVQFATTWIGAIIALVVVYVLWAGGEGDQNGFGPGTALPAPQGGALMGILEAVSQGDVPLGKYVAGSAIGAVLGAAPLSGMGVLVGLAMYLPFSITLGYGLGCFTQMIVQRIKGSTFCEEKLVPLAAGLIVGEALTGVILTAIKIYSNK